MPKMKKIIVFLFLISSIFANSQKLTFDELLSLRNKPVPEISDYLISKGWSFNDTKTYEDNTKSVFWSFQGSDHNSAQHWLTLYLTIDDKEDGIKYQTTNVVTFNAIKSRMKLLNYKLIESKTEEKAIVSIYESNSNKVTLKTMSREIDSSNAFVITIYRK